MFIVGVLLLLSLLSIHAWAQANRAKSARNSFCQTIHLIFFYFYFEFPIFIHSLLLTEMEQNLGKKTSL